MRQNKRTKVMVLLLAATLILSMLQFSVLAAPVDGVSLTIIHVNDRHGRTQLEPYIAAMSEEAKASGSNVLIFDAGDSLHGQTAANLSKGETMVEIMNEVGYSAMVPGNHDFNFGVDRLKELSKKMNFPLLSANVKDTSGQNLFESYKVFEMDGLKVGVFGISTPETVTKSDPRIVAGLTFGNPAEAAADCVAKLKAEECDLIIALTHLGVDASSEPNARSEALAAIDGIDVVIDGHSHTKLDNGKTVNGVLLAQTGAFAENIGVVEITVADGAVSKSAKLVEVPTEESSAPPLPASDKIIEKIAAEEAKIEPITSVVVGNTPVLLQGERQFVRTGETNLSDLITDSMKFATNADIAFLTGGNIRASIDEGDITMGEVLTTLPFSNLLATVELTGTQMLEVLEHGVSSYPEPAGHFIQVSGVKFEFDPTAEPMTRVTNVTMADGSAFDTAKVYTVATIDFITAGGDGYDVMTKAANQTYYQGDVEALAEYLATKPAIAAENDGRAVAIKSAETPAVAAEPAPAPAQKPPAPVNTDVPVKVEASGSVYIVQPGDNLTKIANNCETTWRELHRLNVNITNPNLIYPGQVIIIPAA